MLFLNDIFPLLGLLLGIRFGALHAALRHYHLRFNRNNDICLISNSDMLVFIWIRWCLVENDGAHINLFQTA